MWDQLLVVVFSGCTPVCLLSFTGQCGVDKAIYNLIHRFRVDDDSI